MKYLCAWLAVGTAALLLAWPAYAGDVELGPARFRIIDRGEDKWELSWQMPITNRSRERLTAYVKVSFVDIQGFEWADDLSWSRDLRPGERRTMRSTTDVEAEKATHIRLVKGSVLYTLPHEE